MKKLLPLLLAVLGYSATICAQVTFEKTYGGAFFEEGYSVRQTPDGGYILGGTNLVKVDDSGVEQWSKPIPSFFANPTSDGSYILVHNVGTHTYFTKADANGDTLWQKTFSAGLWANEGEYIEETQDGGYIVAGRLQDFSGSGMLLMKLNAQGGTVWRKTFSEISSAGFNYGFSAQETSDQGFVIAGYSYIDYYDSTRHKDITVVKTDSVGTQQWTKYFGGTDDDMANFVREASDGSYFVAGTTNSYGVGTESNMFLLKLDANGDSLWMQTYGGNFEDNTEELWITNDGGCIIAGSSNSFSSGDLDGYIVKVDSDGNTLWTRSYGGSGIDAFRSVQQTADNGYVIAGYTNSIGAGDYDMWLIKTDSLGEVQQTTAIENTANSHISCEAYPNPSNGIFSIKSDFPISELEILDVTGKTVYSSSVNAKQISIDLSQQPKGIYIYRALVGNANVVRFGEVVFE